MFAVLVTSGALPAIGASLAPPATVVTVAAVKLEYWHRDHIGSLVATSDHNGANPARFAYDPFGKRRYLSSSYDPFGTLVIDWSSTPTTGPDRGFTGHEHLDDVGIVNMNGRVFDPLVARFMQADPLIQDPMNLQSFDRYAYCFNSPLVCTDPSGYLSKYLKNPVRALKFIDPLGNYAATRTAQNEVGYVLGSVAIGIASGFCGPFYALCVAGGTAAWATFAGASDGQALKQGLISGATAYAMKTVGDWSTTSGYVDPDGFWVARSVNAPANIAGHAVVWHITFCLHYGLRSGVARFAAWRFCIAIDVLVGMSEMSSDPSGRSARSVFTAIGVAIVAGVALLGFGRSDPVRPMGVVPTQLQALIEKVVTATGGRVLPDSCTMMGNVNLSVTCKVEGARHEALRSALLKDGWQPTPGPPLAAADEHGAFVRSDEHLSFDSNRDGAVLLVSARKRKP